MIEIGITSYLRAIVSTTEHMVEIIYQGDRHDIAEILLKVALKQQTINQSPQCGDTAYCIRQTTFFNCI
jgi:hypothetical protein